MYRKFKSPMELLIRLKRKWNVTDNSIGYARESRFVFTKALKLYYELCSNF
jgi:hypothetical protein